MCRQRKAHALLICCILALTRHVRAADSGPAPAPVSMPRTSGAVAFDATVRDVLRADDWYRRSVADEASTVLLYSMVATPYFSAGARTVALHGDWRDATGLTLVNTEAFGLAFGFTALLKGLAGRERPYATAAGLSSHCASNPTDPGCGSDRNASFLSGHSAVAFTGAGLVCLQQSVFGSRDLDGCAGGLLVAGLTAGLRMVADMHYATDTLAGAALGLGAGWLVPWLLHFAPSAPFPVARRMRASAKEPRTAGLFSWSLAPWGAFDGGGISLRGAF